MSRTSPIKLATPPTVTSPPASRSSSRPTSKSSRCTRIIASPAELRHSRASGNPGSNASSVALAPRFRGGDGMGGTRIIGLASGHRRKQRDLVAVAQQVITPDIILVDRDPDDRQVAQRLGVGAAAPLQPGEQA